jgi:hypothetical protein
MNECNPLISNFRYHFLPTDNSTLYSKYSRLLGINVKQAPQYNLDDWLNPLSSNFIPAIHDAIFHYNARADKNERVEVCISTKDMDDAAWKYGHHQQIILDGTFGICSSRMLLFITMGVDEEGKGIPLAFFLFSAPTGNRATHAGYDTAILNKLLGQWKRHLGSRHDEGFEPYVCITDTDTKERGALLANWPNLILLLCKFHLRQCWTNKRKHLLASASGAQYWKDFFRDRLHNLEAE